MNTLRTESTMNIMSEFLNINKDIVDINRDILSFNMTHFVVEGNKLHKINGKDQPKLKLMGRKLCCWNSMQFSIKLVFLRFLNLLQMLLDRPSGSDDNDP